jgi:hypothetical protein
MAASTPDARTTERTDNGTVSRYDLLLLVIPAVFVLAVGAAQVSSFEVSTLLAAASLVGGLAVADGLFLNPPRV